MNKPCELIFVSVHQYLISFTFKDNSETQTLIPQTAQIIYGYQNITLNENSVWLNDQSPFEINSITWQNSEVKPQPQTTYTVTGPMNITVTCRVFNATIQVTDNSQTPLKGAQVRVMLANQTEVQAETDPKGNVYLGLIPQGVFNATATYQKTSMTLTGDASAQTVTAATLHLPNSWLFEAAAVAVSLAVATVVLLIVVRKKKPKSWQTEQAGSKS